jgi:hypothetical protein
MITAVMLTNMVAIAPIIAADIVGSAEVRQSFANHHEVVENVESYLYFYNYK